MSLENELFRICKVLLLYGGIWTQEMPSWSKFSQKLYNLFSVSSQCLYASCLPLFIVELCRVFGSDKEAAIAAMKGMTFVGVIIAKMFIIQSKQITKLLESASNEELQIISSTDSEIRKIHKRHVIYCHILALAIVSCLYLTGFIYIGDGLYRSHHFYNTNVNITSLTPKPHPVQLWFPFNKDKYYKTAKTYQILHIAQTLIYNGAAQSVVSSVMVFLIAELKILQHNIRNINPYETSFMQKVSAQRILKEYAKKHQELERWVIEFNSSFQYIILLEYCVTSLTLATTLFEVMQGRKIAFHTVFFVLSTLQLVALAWNANEILLESSRGLSEALYDCPWYDLDQTSKIFIRIMIMRCIKPFTISVGPFGYMDLNAALSRMKLAYSVVSLLSSTN